MNIRTGMSRVVLGALSAFTAWTSVGLPDAQAQTTWTLSATVSGGGGTINGPSSKTVANGGYASFTVTPNPGYHLDTAGNCFGVANSYTNTITSGKITANCTMTVTFAANSGPTFTGPFKHPGILLNRAQLDYIKQQANANLPPWSSAVNLAKASSYGSLTYVASPRSVVDDNLAASETAIKNDSIAAYTQALLWYVTGNVTYANNALNILNGWANTLTGGFVSTKSPSDWAYRVDATLAAQNFTRAAEIMRYTYTNGWTAAEIASFQNMLTTQFLPIIPDGQQQGNYAGYYSNMMAEARMNIGVFNEDLLAFNLGLAAWRKALPAYIYMSSDGATPACPIDWPTAYCTPARLLSLWFNGKSPTSGYVNGLSQDTYAVNMQSVGYGIAALEQGAETAYQQGIDLWNETTLGTLNAQRLAAALEVNAGYIAQCGGSGTSCPSNIAAGFTSASNRVGAWEIAYNHLINRYSGYNLPNTQAYLNLVRPSGVFNTSTAWQTLTHFGQGLRGLPDFSLAPAPGTLKLAPGSSSNQTVTVTSSLDFAGAVNLALANLPAGVTATTASINPPANGAANTALTLSANASAPLGNSVATVVGTSGTTTHTATFNLSITSTLDGSCGADHGATLLWPPNKLCNAGTASTVNGQGHPWSWQCYGTNGGSNASCSANVQTWAISTVSYAGGAISAPGNINVDNGSATTFTVTPDASHSIASVSGSGCSPSLLGGSPALGASYTTGPVYTNCMIAASFSTAVCGNDNGQLLVSTPINLCSAGAASAVSGSGHPWSWSCTDTSSATTASCSATMRTWTVSAITSGNGSITNPSRTVDNGSSTSYTVVPAAGYSLASALGDTCSASITGNTISTGAISNNCTITVTFKRNLSAPLLVDYATGTADSGLPLLGITRATAADAAYIVSPGRNDGYAIAHKVMVGDTSYVSAGYPRSESDALALASTAGVYYNHDEAIYTFSVSLRDWQHNPTNHASVIWQMKHTGGPGNHDLHLEVAGDSLLLGWNGNIGTQVLIPDVIAAGLSNQWIDFRFHVYWANDNTGWFTMDMRLPGETEYGHRVTKSGYPTFDATPGAGDFGYMKWGLYRHDGVVDSGEPVSRLIYHDAVSATMVGNGSGLAGFGISAAPSMLNLVHGTSSSATVTLSGFNGFNAATDLTISDLPNGVSATFSPAALIPNGNASVTSTLSLSADANAPVGPATITLTATSGNSIQSTTFVLNLQAASGVADYSLNAAPVTLNLGLGTSRAETIGLTSLNGFSAASDLSVSNLPAGVTAAFSPATLNPFANGTASASLTLSAAPNASTEQVRAITVKGISGGKVHTTSFNLAVQPSADFSVSLASSLNLTQGNGTNLTTTLTSVNGFSGTANLSVSGLPPGVTATFSPASLSLPAAGSANATLSLSAGANALTGTTPVAITVTAGSTMHTAILNLNVQP